MELQIDLWGRLAQDDVNEGQQAIHLKKWGMHSCASHQPSVDRDDIPHMTEMDD